MTDVDITGNGNPKKTDGWIVMPGESIGWTGDLSFRVRGNFITAYGTFSVPGLKSGETATMDVMEPIIPIEYRPKSDNVRCIAFYGSRTLIVGIKTDGRIYVRNASSKDMPDDATDVNFRADYFVF